MAAVTAVVWVGVLVTTVSVLVRLDPSVPLVLGMSHWSAAAEADTTALAVTTSQPWTAAGDQGWLSVMPQSGEHSATIKIVAEPNTTPADRAAVLTVTSGGTVRTLAVHQSALHPQGMLDVTVASWDVAIGGGTTVIGVTCAREWTAETDATWLGVSTDASSLTLTAPGHGDDSPRSAVVMLGDGVTTLPVTVNQAGKVSASLTLGTSRWSPGTGAATREVEVTSDQTWTVTTAEDWVNLTPRTGTGTGSVTISVTQNTAQRRTATVLVSGGGMTRAVYVVQAGPRPAPTPSATPGPTVSPTVEPTPTARPPRPPTDDPTDEPTDEPTDDPEPVDP